MIAYRAEMWCEDGDCPEGYGSGTVHDDHTQLPGLARNLLKIRLGEGWVERDGKHYCPKHAGTKPKAKAAEGK